MWSLTTLERASYYRINKITAVFLGGQLSNHFSFLNDEDLFASLHNMSYSANDACLDSEKPGFRGGGGGDGYWFPLAGSS
ncbi:hypothetical protein IGI04_023347 [Brassica rapa subsp. trilocularis]|uniref:Uncharacterized protein n=1 Tax=Brassica rapa subsp. trilocularis TaxID=1813537 RepID=A0ABQ7M3L9_BRACM|nr:hypothetical protein IGI04_023347 [Brassica rapa subsp. trilocularis]